ncbi:MAG TPA: cytochrome c [Candidatus Binatia bacterium]|nr:cytochrome c [Candidatus Binatia bacterium]
MRIRTHGFLCCIALLTAATSLLKITAAAQQPTFHNAPPSEAEMKNPYSRSAGAAAAGRTVYAKNCAQCHGKNLQGMGPAPALDTPSVRKAKPGELFWFITNGKPSSGMPSWVNLTKQQRWQIVSFLQSNGEKAAAK